MRFKGGSNLGNFCGPILALFILVSAIRSACAQLTATVLYPLTPPAGISNGYTGIACDDTGQFVATSGGNYAVFWPGVSSAVELNPGASFAFANAVQGAQQVGDYRTLAYLWNGTAASGVSLNPIGFGSSEAFGTDGTQQVGFANLQQFNLNGGDAFLWNGSAATAVNLNPNNITNSSEALATDGTNQVGSAAIGSYANAFLWSGTAASYVNLQPSGFVASVADGVSGGQQVGYGSPPGTNPDLSLDASNVHALLWNGTAASFVDLNPDGWVLSKAFGTNGTQQVGAGFITEEAGQLVPTGNYQALLWSGTAASYVNLETLLPVTNTWVSSEAYGINAAGDVFGYAVDTSGNYFAVEWSPVPEPVSGALLSVVGACLLMRRRGFHFTGC